MADDDLGDMSMMELFRMEAETQTAVLSEGLLELESDPSNLQRVEELMRAAHSLKGAARIVNLDLAVQLAHKMEDRFVEVQEGKLSLGSDDVDCLLSALDQLKLIGTWSDEEVETKSAEARSAVDKLLSQLDAFGSDKPAAESVSAKPETAEVEADSQPAPAPATSAQAEEGAAPAASKPASKPEPAKSSPPAPASVPDAKQEASKDGVVRVASGSLNRLMELAAESLVESRRLTPTAAELSRIQSLHVGIESVMSALRSQLKELGANETVGLTLSQLQQRTEQARERVGDYLKNFDDHLRHNARLAERLYHETLSSRMRPFGEGVGGYPRMVRDLSKALGKKVQFTVLGKSVEVDRDVLEKLDAPLNHILRNALDHGLETPEERKAAGKPECGSLTLEARHHAGRLVIEIADDGRGIDVERLRVKVAGKGLASPEIASGLSEDELLEFLFLPAFSTADKVTEISGRGVGLDVVQSLMQDLGGTARIENRWTQGATFHLELPITRSVARALILEIAGERYAAPLSRVNRICRLPADRIRLVEGRQYVTVDDMEVGLIPARQLLELEGGPESGGEVCLLILSDRGHHYGLEVDGFCGEEEFVVRPLDSRLGKIMDISAVAIQEDGSPILILDIDDLIRSMDRFMNEGHWRAGSRKGPTAAGVEDKKKVLVVDDSITVRQLQKQLLETHGYEAHLANDGKEGWNAVRLGNYDLIVSDVDMPRMTGIELVKHIRQEQRLNHVPVIIVSYKDREEDRLRGMEAGANLYLTKSSFQDETYLNAVRDLIGESGS